MKPRVLFVGRTRYRLPLSPGLARKFAALRAEFDLHVLGSAPAGAPTRGDGFVLVRPLRPRALDGIAFWLALPFRTARLLRAVEPDAVVSQSPYEAAAVLVARRLARSRAKVVLDVHGDWRSATRLYGSPLRYLLSPIADAVARVAVRRADAVRCVSLGSAKHVRELGVEPTAVFPAFVDLESFTATPPPALPERPAALFIGVLERYKAIDVLVDAWRRAAKRLPDATLRIVGAGRLHSLVEQLARDARVVWTPRVTQEEIVRAMDEATVLLLPSRSEGLSRSAIEAFCRGRPVIGSRTGGTPDIVRHGINGLLVEPEDVEGLAEAIVLVLSDRERALRLAAGARQSAVEWTQTPEEFAASVRALVERA
jgi:glycosyltransferase involved in cell wall biosynthesis